MSPDEQIIIINNKICKLFDTISDDRPFLSQNILGNLRTLVEVIATKLAWETEYSYDNFTKTAKEYIRTTAKYRYLYVFHRNLQIVESHYIQNEINSERLMFKYYEYILKIKKLFSTAYNLELFNNLDKFWLHINPILEEYYKKISEKINITTNIIINTNYNNAYYIYKKNPYFINNEIYYEITFSQATDYANKFDRIIAFTKIDIISNYAVNFSISNDIIEISWRKVPILIIQDYNISIRPCEFQNFAKLFWDEMPNSRNKEYKALMDFIKKYHFNLNDIIKFPDEKYDKFKREVFLDTNTKYLIKILDKSREMFFWNKRWINIIQYLLYLMNNKIIKLQFDSNKNTILSNLYVKNKSIPFDDMPFCTSLVEHNPKISHLLESINFDNKEYEFLSRYINNNTQKYWILYTNISDLTQFGDINMNLQKFNSKLSSYWSQPTRELLKYNNYIYIKWVEETSKNIILGIKKFTNHWLKWYSNFVENWINSWNSWVDDEKKVKILQDLFDKSKIALIYWSAWTWKTMLIEHLSNIFEQSNKLFLADTNAAVHNMQTRVNNKNSKFYTIYKFIRSNENKKYNVIVIDECSTISNSDILKILDQIEFDLLVFVWDTYQIESIKFGNWFNIIKNFIPKTSVFELTNPFRTEDEKLIDFWENIRNITNVRKSCNDILEKMISYWYSCDISDDIFNRFDEDEIILCLNYDGIYGINNLNVILQQNNKNPSIQWWVNTYKIWDPVLFNESYRFWDILHNNLKWVITNIEVKKDKVYFTLDVKKEINILDATFNWIEVLEEFTNWKTNIRFYVNKLENTDEDKNDSKNIIPFQVSYAVSIHKSQWLEYNSVKIVISEDIDELITHNIFYTAITRARKNLKIYWSTKTSKLILETISHNENSTDSYILKNKFNL